MAKSLSPEKKKSLQTHKPDAGGGSDVFFKTGDLTKEVIRLLPCNPASDIRQVGESFLDGKGFIDPSITLNKPSLVVEVVRKLQAMKTEKATAIANKIKPRTRFWVKAVIRSSGQVKIVPLPKDIYKVIYEVFDTDEIDLSDADEGMDVRISSNGKGGMEREYTARVLGESPLSDNAKTAKLLVKAGEAINFEDYFKYDPKAIVAALKKTVGGLVNVDKIAADIGFLEDADEDGDDTDADEDDADESDDDEEDDAPKGKKPVAKGKKAPVEDDEDEGEADESDDEEDDEDDEPVAKKKPAAKGKKPAVEEEEEEEDEEDDEADEEDDEEDEEEPAPKGKKAPAKPAPKGKKPAVEEDDEDDESDDEEDDEDDEPAPKGKKPVAKKPVVEDDEDEDESDDEEDDEDEEPAPKAKGGAAAVKGAIKRTVKKG